MPHSFIYCLDWECKCALFIELLSRPLWYHHPKRSDGKFVLRGLSPHQSAIADSFSPRRSLSLAFQPPLLAFLREEGGPRSGGRRVRDYRIAHSNKQRICSYTRSPSVTCRLRHMTPFPAEGAFFRVSASLVSLLLGEKGDHRRWWMRG